MSECSSGSSPWESRMKRTVHLKEFGIRRDNASPAIAEAIAAAGEGGTVVIDSGVWQTGPVDISSPCRIIFEDGAVLSMIPDVHLYRPCNTRWEGADCYGFHPCFMIHDTHDVIIEGSGVIEGNGSWWWETANRKRGVQMEPVTPEEKELAALNPGFREMEGGGGGRESQFLRPDLFEIYGASGVSVSGITLRNSPFWTLHPIYSDNLDISSVIVRNPYDSPNTDGINIDSCHSVQVHGCLVDVGDDGISMKSGCNESGIRRGIPTYDAEVWDCTVLHAHGGFVIGSDSSGGVHDISVHNCRFVGTDRGIRMKTRRGRGGDVHSVRISDIEMEGCLSAITLNMYYRCGAYNPDDFSLDPRPVSERTPRIHDISIERVRASGCRASIAFIAGLPESRAERITISNSSFALADHRLADPSLAEMTSGLPCRNWRGIIVRNADLTLCRTNIASTGIADHAVYEDDGGRAVIIS